LECEQLTLQLQRKNDKNAPERTEAPASTSPSLEIASAHAVGKALVLTSDAESLVAYGNDLRYEATTRRTVLKGAPQTVAMKDGNEIHARELWLGMGGGPAGTSEAAGHATALGPGVVSMLERTPEGVARTLKAHWHDKLQYHKEGPYDCLTLSGNASFEDPTHGQKMKADRLKVWLEPKNDASREPDGARQVRPHHLEAKGRVQASSPELRIEEPTDYLVVWFQEVPAKSDFVDDSAAPPREHQSPAPSHLPDDSTPKPKPDAPRKPLTLSARSVEVHVLRAGNKNELERLWCEGSVHVHQDPDSPTEKGTDIRGASLQLTHSADGGVLVVSGKPAEGTLAQVQFNKLAILGPEVNIDQRGNQAWVNGEGAMQMQSDTNFDGVKLAKPTEMTVHWKERMRFDGLGADFFGGVQATQEASRLLCQNMRVTFDRPVSLKGGGKSGPSPKVDKLLCDKKVFIEEETRQASQLVGYRRLVAPEVSLDNANKSAEIPGPGVVRVYQLGNVDESLLAPPAAGNRPKAQTVATPKTAKEEFKITHVVFRDRMQAKNGDSRTATFWGDVHAVHVPADKPEMEIDLDKPPPGYLYLHCDNLRVLTHKLPNGRSSQEMVAKGKVQVRAGEFWALSDVVKYDEAQDRVIFEGGEGGMASLYQIKGKGGEQAKTTARKIIYWRKTNEVRIENSSGLSAH
jgi:hypothetical protein